MIQRHQLPMCSSQATTHAYVPTDSDSCCTHGNSEGGGVVGFTLMEENSSRPSGVSRPGTAYRSGSGSTHSGDSCDIAVADDVLSVQQPWGTASMDNTEDAGGLLGKFKKAWHNV